MSRHQRRPGVYLFFVVFLAIPCRATGSPSLPDTDFRIGSGEMAENGELASVEAHSMSLQEHTGVNIHTANGELGRPSGKDGRQNGHRPLAGLEPERRCHGPVIAKVMPGLWMLTKSVLPSGEKQAPANSLVLVALRAIL